LNAVKFLFLIDCEVTFTGEIKNILNLIDFLKDKC
jgi:hypothetical protein